MKKMRKLKAQFLLVVSFLFIPFCVVAADISQEKAQLQVDVDALGRDVIAMENSVLFPATSRVDVLLSLTPELQYTPQTVTLSVDGNQLATHSYSEKEITGLRSGGLHPLWQGNLSSGSHQLQAVFTGLDRKGKPVQNMAKLDFEKASNRRSLELKITSIEEGEVAVFSVKDWGDKE